MNSTKSSPKRIEKVSSDSALLSFDLFSNLTYMSALATGGVSRDVIFEYVIEQSYKTVIYFKQVYLLAKRLGFDYARSFQLVSTKAKAETMKSLLLRFAGSISSGESEQEFLAQEARVEKEEYVNQYHRSLETLQKWGDAYAALLVSTSLIVVVAMISTMLHDIGNTFVYILNGTMFCMSLGGTWIIFKTAPAEVVTYKNRRGPKDRRVAGVLLITLGPVGLLAAVYLTISSGLGPAFLVLGFFLMPAGIFAFKDDMKVTRIDQELSKFLRSLGNVSESLGSTLSHAMTKIDRRSMGVLEPYVLRLQRRLKSQISPKVCWDRFMDETGSELVHRSTTMFVDGTSLGGSPEKVGSIASDYAMSIALLRARRHVTALPFAYLTIPLHGAMSALLIFVLELMTAFNQKLATASAELVEQSADAAARVPNLHIFATKDMSQTALLTMGAVLILTIANAMAAQFATGGHSLKLVFYLGIMCILSGTSLFLIPPIAHKLLA